MFQRSRRVFHVNRKYTRCRRAPRECQFSIRLAIKIAALVGGQGEWLDVSPGSIGCVAVEDRRIGIADAVNQ